jgi:hypothetical protein
MNDIESYSSLMSLSVSDIRHALKLDFKYKAQVLDI